MIAQEDICQKLPFTSSSIELPYPMGYPFQCVTLISKKPSKIGYPHQHVNLSSRLPLSSRNPFQMDYPLRWVCVEVVYLDTLKTRNLYTFLQGDYKLLIDLFANCWLTCLHMLSHANNISMFYFIFSHHMFVGIGLNKLGYKYLLKFCIKR